MKSKGGLGGLVVITAALIGLSGCASGYYNNPNHRAALAGGQNAVRHGVARGLAGSVDDYHRRVAEKRAAEAVIENHRLEVGGDANGDGRISSSELVSSNNNIVSKYFDIRGEYRGAKGKSVYSIYDVDSGEMVEFGSYNTILIRAGRLPVGKYRMTAYNSHSGLTDEKFFEVK